MFFEGDGDIFRPWLTLHGSELQRMRRSDVEGKETVIGEAVLDLERFRQYRVILTNYETVTNYQHSFARMKERWTVVVTDEAQEYKTPNTKISHALKSLSPRFRVACTGTPVETRLLDVWNIFDFLQPGHLRSAAEFTQAYEKPVEESPEGGSVALSQLKDRLHIHQPQAFVLRRDKAELSGFPIKHEHRLMCDLSSEQREWHLDLVSRARAGGEGNHPLALIQRLMYLYQHPALVPHYEPSERKEALERCPKLAKVKECLRQIRNRGQKVLIFTRSLNMQQLLSSVIGSEFDLEVDIINGATSRRGDTKNASRTRKAILSRFRESPGFNVLVLSPDVAGIGLTLVEANHVIHYGRWWNPAKESQATDRVYRIGQTRDVHVYYPIAKDPQGLFETFDEKLDKLIKRRQALATEFLAPMSDEEALGRDFQEEILGTEGIPDAQRGVRVVSEEDLRRMTWDRFEALIAVLEENGGAQVLLTPRTRDEGIDVIAIQGREIRLIQCKHTLWDGAVDAEAVSEMIQAFDGYRVRYLRSTGQRYALCPILVTNGRFTARARAEAGARDIRLVDNTNLCQQLESTSCTLGDVEVMEDRRFASLRDVQASIEQLIGSRL